MSDVSLILIVYTTRYRKGGARFARVAKTMAQGMEGKGSEVLCRAVESKQALKKLFKAIGEQGQSIAQYHFIGHSGMYGPMFGTVDFPEQFSPWELNQLQIPWAAGAEAYFHCCRSARWYAPYFARVQDVKAFGYHWYTAFSSRPDRYTLDLSNDPEKPLYCFGCIGKKSHGLPGSLRKYLGVKAEQMIGFAPKAEAPDRTYNKVATLYDAVFQDITVREDEWHWLEEHIPFGESLRVLDIGCGNGALLKALAPKVGSGLGIDISAALIEKAWALNAGQQNIAFRQISGPEIPCPDRSMDVVISMLSFRYLDWDPMLAEIDRVLVRGGRLLIVDMVTAPVRWKEWPLFLKSKWKFYRSRAKRPGYFKALAQLVSDPAWKEMLRFNPIRSEHEMMWYLESRFPGRKAEVINIGMHSRIIAFDSGPVEQVNHIQLSYP